MSNDDPSKAITNYVQIYFIELILNMHCEINDDSDLWFEEKQQA